MESIRHRAAYFRLALRLGLVNLADVVSWSDSIVEKSDRPHPAFLELSSLWKAHPLDVVHVLRSMSEDVSDIEVLPSVLALAHRKLQSEPAFGRHLATALYAIFVECDFPFSHLPNELCEIGQEITWFDNAFGLVPMVFGSVEAIEEIFLQFMQQFETKDGDGGE